LIKINFGENVKLFIFDRVEKIQHIAYRALKWAEFVLIAATLTILLLSIWSFGIWLFKRQNRTYLQILQTRLEMNGCMGLLAFLVLCEIARRLMGIQI